MAHSVSTSRANYFHEIPVAAVVYGNTLAQRTAAHPLLSKLRRYTSHALTATLLIISVTGLFFAASTVLSERAAVDGKPPSSLTPQYAAAAPAQKSPAFLPKSPPTQLDIPSIGLTASTVAVGQNSDGSMEVPAPDVVGWYNRAPTPGELGPAVMTGHLDSAVSGPAIFWNLKKVKPGDKVLVTRADSKVVTFKVEKTEVYDQANFPAQAVYGNIDYPGLRLITCDGAFNYATRNYSKNLVVYAKAVL